MIAANLVAEARYLDASRSRRPGHLRGQFVPWALLKVPENGRMFKLTRRTLLVSSTYKAFLYDVEKAELQRTIQVNSPDSGQLRYVDFSEKHVLVLGTRKLDIYDRPSGSHVLTIPAGPRPPRDLFASAENRWRRAGKISNNGELAFQQVTAQKLVNREDYFHAGAWSWVLRT